MSENTAIKLKYIQVYDNKNVYYILCKKNNVNAIIRNILKYTF